LIKLNGQNAVAGKMRFFVNRFPAWTGEEINTSEQFWLPRIKEIIAYSLANQVMRTSVEDLDPFCIDLLSRILVRMIRIHQQMEVKK